MSAGERFLVAGKSEPEIDELERVSSDGFNHVELFTTPEILDNNPQAAIDQTDLNVATVHTPHVPRVEGAEYLIKADRLAARNDAKLVVHSKSIPVNEFSMVEEDFDFKADYGYENPSGQSEWHLNPTILEPENGFVLDVAHLYCAHADYLDRMENLLEEHHEQTKAIHFCDSYRDKDGVALGTANMDMEACYEILADSDYEGPVTIEVPKKDQADSLERWKSYNS